MDKVSGTSMGTTFITQSGRSINAAANLKWGSLLKVKYVIELNKENTTRTNWNDEIWTELNSLIAPSFLIEQGVLPTLAYLKNKEAKSGSYYKEDLKQQVNQTTDQIKELNAYIH